MGGVLPRPPGPAPRHRVAACRVLRGLLEMADELLEAVISGPKRATAALVAEFADGDEELPRIGSHWICCDGSGRPRLVMRSMELRVGPVNSVDEAFAYDEGEGERTRDWWLDAHSGYWQRSCADGWSSPTRWRRSSSASRSSGRPSTQTSDQVPATASAGRHDRGHGTVERRGRAAATAPGLLPADAAGQGFPRPRRRVHGGRPGGERPCRAVRES